MPPTTATSEFLILRKSVFGDAGLVLAGLTPEHGQLHVLWKGARRLGHRHFPAADLFRLVRLEYRPPGHGDLAAWRGVEPLADWSALAHDLAAYQAAGRLAAFALANAPAGLPAPRLFQALRTALERLATARAAAIHQATCGVFIQFLDEQGWLPDFSADPARAGRVQALLAMAAGAAPPPPLPPEQWPRIEEWLMRQLRFHECRL
ncbi:MAG: DNA repair protein RecO C-terminal domain-containing protein [Lentisphaeria bacterium]|jgi:recombinational DNA repair protein (RecF pathway)